MIGSIILLSLMVAAFSLYIAMVYYVNNGPLESISKSYYMHDPKKRWIFQLWIFFLAGGFTILGSSIWFCISGPLLVLVGLFPTIKNEKHLPWHIAGAIGSIVNGFIGISADMGNYYFACIMAGSSITAWLYYKRISVWYIEIIAFYLIIIYFIWKIWQGI